MLYQVKLHIDVILDFYSCLSCQYILLHLIMEFVECDMILILSLDNLTVGTSTGPN